MTIATIITISIGIIITSIIRSHFGSRLKRCQALPSVAKRCQALPSVAMEDYDMEAHVKEQWGTANTIPSTNMEPVGSDYDMEAHVKEQWNTGYSPSCQRLPAFATHVKQNENTEHHIEKEHCDTSDYGYGHLAFCKS